MPPKFQTPHLENQAIIRRIPKINLLSPLRKKSWVYAAGWFCHSLSLINFKFTQNNGQRVMINDSMSFTLRIGGFKSQVQFFTLVYLFVKTPVHLNLWGRGEKREFPQSRTGEGGFPSPLGKKIV